MTFNLRNVLGITGSISVDLTYELGIQRREKSEIKVWEFLVEKLEIKASVCKKPTERVQNEKWATGRNLEDGNI